MGFNTLAFVFAFLPLFLAAFYLVPARWRAALLCLGSLVFYVIGVWKRPWCLAPLLGLAALVYFLGRGMQPRKSRGLLALGLAALFGCLFFFKYAGLLGLGVTLPLAISFYSFQLAAYLIDVYRGRVTAETKPLLFFTGVLLFPKLLSGPLMDPLSLHEQLSDPPRPGLEDFDSGLRDFILGLSMKVLLATRSAACGVRWGTSAMKACPRLWRGWASRPTPCSCIWTSAAIPGWPWAWGGCWASGCPGTLNTPTPPAPCRTSGGGGTSASAPGSGITSISPWAAAGRGRPGPT